MSGIARNTVVGLVTGFFAVFSMGCVEDDAPMPHLPRLPGVDIEAEARPSFEIDAKGAPLEERQSGDLGALTSVFSHAEKRVGMDERQKPTDWEGLALYRQIRQGYFQAPVVQPHALRFGSYRVEKFTVQNLAQTQTYTGQEESYWSGQLELYARGVYAFRLVRVEENLIVQERSAHYTGRFTKRAGALHFEDETGQHLFSLMYRSRDRRSEGEQGPRTHELHLTRTTDDVILPGEDEFLEMTLTRL